jgi:hypothetical protein
MHIIDDLSAPHPQSSHAGLWQCISDGVMGGLSAGNILRETRGGRPALCLRGNVSLENNGGFVQMALDLSVDGGLRDAGAFDGVELEVCGNGETYSVHLRTDAVTRPWQSWRQNFVATPAWQTIRLPFSAFEAHRINAPLDPRRLRRLGIVAIGRAFDAEVAVARIGFYSGTG